MRGLAKVMSHEPWRLDLIRDYLPLAERSVRWHSRRYPGADLEPLIYQALYLAAFTYRPGKRGFCNWFASKVRGATSAHRKHLQSRARGKPRRGPTPAPAPEPLDPDAQDRRLIHEDVHLFEYEDTAPVLRGPGTKGGMA